MDVEQTDQCCICLLCSSPLLCFHRSSNLSSLWLNNGHHHHGAAHFWSFGLWPLHPHYGTHLFTLNFLPHSFVPTYLGRSKKGSTTALWYEIGDPDNAYWQRLFFVCMTVSIWTVVRWTIIAQVASCMRLTKVFKGNPCAVVNFVHL